MHSPLTAVVLCLFAQAAAAQCTPATVAHDALTAAEVSRAPVVLSTTKAPAPQVKGELIKTAAAGTRDAPVAMVREPSVHAASSDEHPRRGGTAMLLAALALMSGIALRRFGAPRQ